MHETFYMHTMTLQYTDDVVVMYTFHKGHLGLWGWVRVQTRAGVHIGTVRGEQFYASLRSSIDNALEHVFVDAYEEHEIMDVEPYEGERLYRLTPTRKDGETGDVGIVG